MEKASLVRDLIYDVGMHNGDDSAFYLHQGFRVVAVEADPHFSEKARQTFAAEIHAAQLTIVNVGIAERSGTKTFWICDENPQWNSFYRQIASRNGGMYHAVEVPTRRFGEILDEFGVPVYLKIDIEGSDRLCLLDLAGRPRPEFVSVESECVGDEEDPTDAGALASISLLYEIGYRAFKLIRQWDFAPEPCSDVAAYYFRLIHSAGYGRLRVHGISRIAKLLSNRVRLSREHGYDFPAGGSGPWGDGTPGEWLPFERAKTLYMKARERHFKIVKAVGIPMYSFWYDWHARLRLP
jgi:FkbM family methyltransferase